MRRSPRKQSEPITLWPTSPHTFPITARLGAPAMQREHIVISSVPVGPHYTITVAQQTPMGIVDLIKAIRQTLVKAWLNTATNRTWLSPVDGNRLHGIQCFGSGDGVSDLWTVQDWFQFHSKDTIIICFFPQKWRIMYAENAQLFIWTPNWLQSISDNVTICFHS